MKLRSVICFCYYLRRSYGSRERKQALSDVAVCSGAAHGAMKRKSRTASSSAGPEKIPGIILRHVKHREKWTEMFPLSSAVSSREKRRLNRNNTLVLSSYELVNNRVAAVYWSPYRVHLPITIFRLLNYNKAFCFSFQKHLNLFL